MSLSNNRLRSTNLYGAFQILDNPGLLGIGAVPASFDFSGNGVFRGASVEFTNLPTCSQTPTTGTQLITKAFADATYTGTDITVLNNTWTGTNTFNTYAPSSSVTPSSGNDLCNKTYVDLKAPLASPTFTGTVGGINKTMVGLSNVDNTSDANKPVSTAQQIALNLKANLASPTFTGTVAGIDKTMVGLANVNNTSDANKPVSTATTTELNLKAYLASPTFTGTPLAPTATLGTNTTQLATTAFVLANAGASSTFATDITVHTLTVGQGTGSVATNTAVGYQAQLAIATGGLNTAVGYQANNANTSGNSNTAIGHSALLKNTIGHNNTAIGHNALANFLPTVAGGTLNTAVGESSAFALTTGTDNVAIGYNSLRSATTGIKNTALGNTAYFNGDYTQSTAIGYGAQPSASNQVVLGTSTETVIIPGKLKYSLTDASSSPMAKFQNNNAFSAATNTQLTFTTGSYDTYGGRFATANQYTVGVSGYYSITSSYSKSGGLGTQTSVRVDVRYNGGPATVLFNLQSTAITVLSGTTIIAANAGDYFLFYGQIANAETPTFTQYISWVRGL